MRATVAANHPQGRDAEAEEALRIAYDREADREMRACIGLYRGLALHDLGRHQDALQLYRAMAEQGPRPAGHSIEILGHRSAAHQLLHYLEQPVEAVDELAKVVSLAARQRPHADHGADHLELGSALLRMERYEEALDALDLVARRWRNPAVATSPIWIEQWCDGSLIRKELLPLAARRAEAKACAEAGSPKHLIIRIEAARSSVLRLLGRPDEAARAAREAHYKIKEALLLGEEVEDAVRTVAWRALEAAATGEMATAS